MIGIAWTHLERCSKLFQIGQLSLAFRFRHGLALFLQLFLLVLDEPLDISLDRLGSTCGSLSRPQHRQPGHKQAISTSIFAPHRSELFRGSALLLGSLPIGRGHVQDGNRRSHSRGRLRFRLGADHLATSSRLRSRLFRGSSGSSRSRCRTLSLRLNILVVLLFRLSGRRRSSGGRGVGRSTRSQSTKSRRYIGRLSLDPRVPIPITRVNNPMTRMPFAKRPRLTCPPRPFPRHSRWRPPDPSPRPHGYCPSCPPRSPSPTSRLSRAFPPTPSLNPS